jgi:K+-transporting ATPase ATPase C chain
MRDLRPALVAVLVFTLLLGLAYPLAMTGTSQVLFGGAADGSVVERDGRPVGSSLIGQDFSADLSLFQSRPSATEYSAEATFFNNLGPNQQDLADLLRENVETYVAREGRYTRGLAAARVPSDAATTSASGIDPHISRENANIQANRVARERGLDLERVRALIDEHGSRPLLGLGEQESINVLELNLALEATR